MARANPSPEKQTARSGPVRHEQSGPTLFPSHWQIGMADGSSAQCSEGLLKSPSMRARSRGQPANDHTRRTLVLWPVATTRSSHCQLHTNRRHAHSRTQRKQEQQQARASERVPIDTIRMAPSHPIRWETESAGRGRRRRSGAGAIRQPSSHPRPATRHIGRLAGPRLPALPGRREPTAQ